MVLCIQTRPQEGEKFKWGTNNIIWMCLLLLKWMPFHPMILPALLSGLEDLEQGLPDHEECVLIVADICYHFLLLTKRSLPHWGLCELPQCRHPLISFSLLPVAVCAPVRLHFSYLLRELSSSLIHTLSCASIPILFPSLSFPQVTHALLSRIKHHNFRRFLKSSWLCQWFTLYQIVLNQIVLYQIVLSMLFILSHSCFMPFIISLIK